MDHKLQKWLRWIDVLQEEVQEVLIAKHMFHEVQAMIRDNPLLHLNSSFYEYFARTYVSHIVMGVRRQVKLDAESISMARLFQEMIETPQTLTRKYYTDKYKGTVVESFADVEFEKFAATDAAHIDPSLIEKDLTGLRLSLKRCEDFADKRVAHRDTRDLKEIPTFNEVDACVDLLDELCVKYLMLFHASAPDTLLPTWQYDWKAIFRVPWIPGDEKI